MKKLEEHLGLSLFDRSGRRLRLTEDGKLVFGFAEQIFGLGSHLLEAVENRRTGQTVVCSVGVDSVLPKLEVRRMLQPLLTLFGDRLQLRCEEGGRSGLVGKLRARALDLVLSDAPSVLSATVDLRSAQLADSALALFAAPGLQDTLVGPFPACLDGAPFLLPMPTTRARREIERWLGMHELRPRVAAEMEDSGLIKAFGQQGVGVFAMTNAVADEVCAQYSVAVLGVTEEVRARTFMLTHAEPTKPARALLDAWA